MIGAPRYISSMTRAVVRWRNRTFVAARASGYGKPRSPRGASPMIRSRRAWTISLKTSPIDKDDPPDVAIGADEEPIQNVAAAELSSGVLDRRCGEVAARRVAGEEVPDRSSAVREKAVTP